MSDIPIFRAERQAGLANRIRRERTAGCMVRAKVAGPRSVQALIPTGWGTEDVVIDRLELWSARTSTGGPLAFADDCQNVIGKVVATRLVDTGGRPVPASTPVEALPAVVALQVAAELHGDQPDLLQALGRAEVYCLATCRFDDFDYAIREPDGTIRVVRRTGETAHFSQSLKCFGGSGRHEGRPIGRVLRRLTVSVDGLVHVPPPDVAQVNEAIRAHFGEPTVNTTDFGEFLAVVAGGSAISTPVDSPPPPMSSADFQKAVTDVQQFLGRHTEARTPEPPPPPATGLAADVARYLGR